MIQLQAQYNRYNQVNPFGTARWSTDENGHETLTTTPSDRSQAAIDRAFTAAETPFQRLEVSPGLSSLADAILGRVGARYGLGDSNPNNPYLGLQTPSYGPGKPFSASAKPQQSPPPPMGDPRASGFAQSQNHGG